MAATHVNHMQKVMDQMNLQPHHQATSWDKRDWPLLTPSWRGSAIRWSWRNYGGERIKASEAVIAKSLVGDYRHEHLFGYHQMTDACDREIRQHLEDLQPPTTPTTAPIGEAEAATKKQSSDGVLRSELQRVWGVDLTRIPGIRTGVAQTLFGEISPDFAKFRSASAFAFWMGLCPDNDIGGGRVLFVGTRKVKCRAALALRMAAHSLHHSKSALGDFYRRMSCKLGAPKAVPAAAHKLARIIFHLISTRQEFDDSKFAPDQLRYHKHQEAKFHARARSIGYAVVPLEVAG